MENANLLLLMLKFGLVMSIWLSLALELWAFARNR